MCANDVTATLLASGVSIPSASSPFANRRHAVDTHRRVFEVTATGEFFLQITAYFDRRLYRPGTVWIDAKRHIRAELPAKLPDRFDLDLGLKDAAFELDRTEAVLVEHLLDLPYELFRREGFAILVFPSVIALATAAGVLVERIRGERNLVANAAADQIANRLSD